MIFKNTKNWQVIYHRITKPECCRSNEMTYDEALQSMFLTNGVAIVQVYGWGRGRRVSNPSLPLVLAQMQQKFGNSDDVTDVDFDIFMTITRMRLESEGKLPYFQTER